MEIVLFNVSENIYTFPWTTNTWKKVRKKSSFFLAAPRSKQAPQVSSNVQHKRILKKSSGISRGFNLPHVGVPPAVYSSVNGSEIAIIELTVSESNDPIECVKYQRRVNHFVIV